MYKVSRTILSIPLGPRLVLMASATAKKHNIPLKFSYPEYHSYLRFAHLSQQWCCSYESQWACPCLWMHPAYYQLQNLYYLTSLAFQALWLNFSMGILTMQGLRRLTKRSKRPMITDSVTKFQMLSKVVVLLVPSVVPSHTATKWIRADCCSAVEICVSVHDVVDVVEESLLLFSWASLGNVRNMSSSKEDDLNNKPLDKLPEPEPTPETKVM